MSLTGPSRTGAIGVVFLALIFVALIGVLWSLDRFHAETKKLTDVVADLKIGAGSNSEMLRGELGDLRRTIARSFSGAKVQLGNGSGNDQADSLPPHVSQKRYPVGGTYVARGSEVSTMNRWITSEGRVRTMCNYIHDALVGISPDDLSLEPWLATKWEISEDKLRYTFWLRQGVVFSDGSPFTSEDVVYTVNLIRDETVKSDFWRESFKEVGKVEAVGTHKVVFHYKKKYWRGLYACAYSPLRIFSAKWVREKVETIAAKDRAKYPEGSYATEPFGKRFGELYNEIREPSVGTGPYTYDPKKSWVKGQMLSLYRNPRSWWMKVHPDKWNLGIVRWRFINDDVVLWEACRKAQLDISVVDPDKWFGSFKDDKTITNNFNMYRYDHVGIGHNLVVWNCRRPQFQDKRVRQALGHLIDRKTMLEIFDHGVGDYATCPFKKWYEDYSFDIEPRLLDIPKARQLLAEAGWADKNRDGILEKDGLDFRFEMMVPSGRSEYTRFGQLWQGHMEKVGIRLDVRPLEWKTFIGNYRKNDFDAACLYESHSDPWIECYESFISTQTGPLQVNHSGWHLPEVDKMLEDVRTVFDPVERRKIWHKFNRIRWEHAPQQYLLHGEVIIILHKRYKRVSIKKGGANPRDWYIPENERLYDANGTRLRQ